MLAAAIGAALGGAASAQESADSAEQKPIDSIVVTGSYLVRPADRPQPVVVVGQQDIQADQRISLGEVMRDMPQVTGVNTNGTSGSVLRSATGSNSINIRGLGDRSTLVLLNGQRQTIDGNAASVVDINALTPAIMVERVEMVLDGSSALYGSDAVAAVVNFVTRDDFEGAELNVSGQFAEAQGDAPETLVSGILGFQGDDRGLVMALEWSKRSRDMLESDVFSPEILDRQGLHSGDGNPGTFTGLDNGLTLPDPLCGSPEIGGNPALRSMNPAGFVERGSCRENLTTFRTLEPRSDRLTGLLVGHLDFEGGGLRTFRIETGFSRDERRRAFSTGSPVSSLVNIGAVVPASNPGVIDANQRDPANFLLQDYTLHYRSPYSPIEGYVTQANTQSTYRVASSLEGGFGAEDGSWSWKLSGALSRNDTVSENPETIAQRLNLALNGYGGPDCNFNGVLGAENDPNVAPGTGPCMYYNPFASRLLAQPGDPTYNDPAVVQWFSHQETEIGTAQLGTLEAVATGDLFDLPGGRTGLAIGAQLRRQTLDIKEDVIATEGGFASDPQPLKSWSAARDTKAVFAELAMYPSEILELDLAARWEDTEGASSTEPKISALLTPTDKLSLRASWGTSFRVPSEVAAFGVSGEGGRGSIYIGGEFPQAEGYTVGNPDLEPEQSENWSVGFNWDVTDSLTLGATYWSYKFTDLVTRTEANKFLEADIADGFIDDTVHNPVFPGAPNEVCEVTGRWDPSSGDPLPAGCATAFDIAVFNTFWVNQNELDTSGVDFDVSFDAAAGDFDLRTRLAGTYVATLKGVDAVTGELRDGAGTDGYNLFGVDSNNRQWRGTLTQEMRRGNHYLRLTGRYTGKYEVTDPNANPLVSNASYTRWDLNYTFTLARAHEAAFSLAVLNLTDRDPPLSTGSLIYNSMLFDGRGRMFKAGFNFGL
jgi:iron complex outermembrane receptor protein